MRRRKAKLINFRTTQEDYEKIKKRADGAGLNLTAYITTMALNGKIIVVPGVHEAAYELSKIGGNLNQLTRLCHEGRITCPELSEMKIEVKNVWQSLRSPTQKNH